VSSIQNAEHLILAKFFNKTILYISFVIRFESTPHQARKSIRLQKNEGVLAVPQYFRGNPPISDDTITSVIDFYREDGISRISSNSKDTIQINRNTVPIRFMEMNVLDAFRLFNERFPGVVGRSTLHSSRPRDVKIVSPHDTCMCIIHENMNLLIKVRIYPLSSIYFSKNFNRI
jgi:hypothetical protein